MLTKKLVIATRNPAKVKYYHEVFINTVGEVVGLNDLNINGKPEESGETAEQNAEIKAKYYSTKTDLPVFCEDESLFVDFLTVDKQPGTHIRRINGVDEVSDQALFDYWENIIRTVAEQKRTGFWRVAYCLGKKGKVKVLAVEHPVKFFYPASKIRIPGWPMSSLEGAVRFNKPNSERTEEEKRLVLLEETPRLAKMLEKLLDT